METIQTRRNSGIDLIKTLAILGVIVIHTCGGGYSDPPTSFRFLTVVFYSSVVRASVPLFLMCSGALLLNPEKPLTLRRLLTHNLPRILAALFVWAAAYKCYYLIRDHSLTPSALIQAGKELLTFQHEFHLYYLHILLIVYAFLPVTRIFVRHGERKELQYGLLLWFLLGILYPTLKPYWPFTLIQGFPTQWLINMTYSSIGYGVWGYYLLRYPLSRKAAALSAIAGFLIVMGGTVIGSIRNGALYEHFQNGMTVGNMLLATGIFGLCSGVSLSKGLTALTGRVSKAAFCIYLCHVFWLYLLRSLGLTIALFTPVASVPLFSLINLALSYGTYLLLSRIPFVRRWCI